MNAPQTVPTAPIRKMTMTRPVSFQILFMLHCSSRSGIPIGTAYPQMISSYSTQLVGMMARLDRTSAKISAMMAPEILEAQSYFCSRYSNAHTDHQDKQQCPGIVCGHQRFSSQSALE